MRHIVERLGEYRFDSPLRLSQVHGDKIANFVRDGAAIVVDPDYETWIENRTSGSDPDVFELAGPRKRIFHSPENSRAAIVTCGGLCPGVNDVIRALVMVLYYQYGVRDILGIRYGYRGMTIEYGGTARVMKPETVLHIHKQGGSYLGSSRGPQTPVEMADFLQRRNINMLFIIGGDGTIRGALDITRECEARKLPVSIIGIPKTIDNDIAYIDRSFGFSTAVSRAKMILDSAHVEAQGAVNGIGLVKLMGRHSGFIAARAALGSGDANFVLVPEIPFDLDGDQGFLAALDARLQRAGHALVVVAEGAGQSLIPREGIQTGNDASGNIRLWDIGTFLRDRIQAYFTERSCTVNIKYIDPSYYIRSVPANAEDSVFCQELAQHAVHAAMSGRTRTVVGTWLRRFVHIPMDLTVSRRKVLEPEGLEWIAVLESTGQPASMSAG